MYKGRRVAVDAYCWLHKGCCADQVLRIELFDTRCHSCSLELANGVPTDKYIYFCMTRVELLRRHGVIPVVRGVRLLYLM